MHSQANPIRAWLSSITIGGFYAIFRDILLERENLSQQRRVVMGRVDKQSPKHAMDAVGKL
jgi:hypothetical protein